MQLSKVYMGSMGKLSGTQLTARCLCVVAVVLMICTQTCVSDRYVFPLHLNIHGSGQSGCTFPSSLRVDIQSQSPFPAALLLHRKDVIDTNAPAYVVKRRHNGEVFVMQIENGPKVSAAYQNHSNGAAFLLKCTSRGQELTGTIYVDGRKYRVNRLPSRDKIHAEINMEGSRSAKNSVPAEKIGTKIEYYEFSMITETRHFDDHVQVPPKRRSQSTAEGNILESKHRTARHASRIRRETKDYYLDVLVALDFAFYSYWVDQVGGDSKAAIDKAKEYIAYIFNGINSRFTSARTAKYNLHLVLSGFLIAQTAEDSPWTENVKQTTGSGVTQVNANTVMSNLENYVRDNSASLPAHDHFMLFTEYDLFGDDNGFRFNNTAGFAYIASMCYTDGKSISVIEDHGGFQSEGTATHEIGHSLGAKHDGDGNRCSSADRYVMAGGVHAETQSTQANPWLFSSCSVDYFSQHIESLISKGYESTCLLSRVTASGVPSVSGLPGQLAGPDEQCRQIFGPRSYLCRGTSFGTAQDVCSAMYCKNPDTASSCTLNTAASGTCCGNGKWCSGGKCVGAQEAKCYISATCPFGQREGPVYQNKTCEELESGNCYIDNFRHICCKMCDGAKTNLAGCEYGDKVRGCNAEFCGRKLESGQLYDVDCCGTCSFERTTLTPPVTSKVITTTTTTQDPCRDTVLVNGKEQCSVYLDREGVSACCQSQIKDGCCRSCTDRMSDDPTCPYGDCADCTVVLKRASPCGSSLRQSCCKTCKDLDSKLASQTSPSPSSPPTKPTAKPTRVPPSGSEADAVECVPLLGVKTCGCAMLSCNGFFMSIVLFVVFMVFAL